MAKTALITGGTAGIGRAAALALARLGFDVFITGRDDSRCRQAAEEIAREAGSGSVHGDACDLTSLVAVQRYGAEFLTAHPSLDVLVLNAGAFNRRRVVTAEGFEETFAERFLGHVLLTEAALPALQATGDGRVIVTASSPRVFTIDFDDVKLERRYSWTKALNNALCALLLYSLDLARRYENKGLSVNFMHPGYVDTGLFNDMPWLFRAIMRAVGSSPEIGADTIVYLATEPSLRGVTGAYFRNRRKRSFGGTLTDRAKQVRARELAWELLRMPDTSE
jgi:retinol dehydrogenase 14